MVFKKLAKATACVLALSMMLSVSGCGGDDGNENTPTSSAESESTKKPEKGEENKDDKNEKPNVQGTGFQISEEDKKLYDSIFDISNNVKVKIDIEDEELQKIQKDFNRYDSFHSKSPIYRKCNLTI